ncbi:N-acetylneuraminate lyase-like isoform X2 [Phymastichus coffea]|uniref:N-acetylneuraminate lyase-like isoform X2 n=1 Tax=Phymastichus coffea TaxID=108790 RepID=UPI00273ABE7A|nr:N-acetylneuraminate lyase-like isoform X2 [Phymastichus coffea]
MTSALRYAYRGLVVPVFTPFKANAERSVNAYLIPRYSDYLKSNNIDGVLANGTTGEGMTMSVSERKEVAEAWVEAARRNGQHLIVQVGGAPLADVKELARHAQSLDVDAVLCLPELYYRPSDVEELVDYVKQVSEAAPKVPLLYYHFPDMSNVRVHMGKFLESVRDRIPNLVGIKFTSTNLEEGSHAVDVENKRYVVFLGSNLIIPAGSACGIDSFMPSSTNLFPELLRSIVRHSSEGDYATAKTKQQRVVCAFRKLSQLGPVLSAMKAAMSHISPIAVGPSRKPLRSFDTEEDQRRLMTILKALI